MKQLFSLSLIILISACSHYRGPIERQANRCTASNSINKCSNIFDTESISAEKLKQEQEQLEQKLQTEHDIKKTYEQFLEPYTERGNKKFVLKSEFIFQHGLVTIDAPTGIMHKEAYTVNYLGKKLFIKKYSQFTKLSELLKNIHNAKMMEALEIGPKVELVKIKKDYYLVMDKLSGINTKDITDHRLRETAKQFLMSGLSTALGRKVINARQAQRDILQKLSTPSYISRLKEIRDILIENGYYDIYDLQIMVDTSIGPSSMKIIDADFFLRSNQPDFPLPISSSEKNRPTERFETLFKDIRDLSN